MTHIIAVTACPSGVAHTYMAAEAIERAAKAKGWECKVETQGSIGLENELTPEDVAAADRSRGRGGMITAAASTRRRSRPSSARSRRPWRACLRACI